MKTAKVIDFEALAARARRANTFTLAASEDEAQIALEEIASPEQMLLLLEEAGARVDVVRDPETGEINEIHASVGFDDGQSNIIPSIQATGPAPSKILGDLAQTSVDSGSPVSTTGTFTANSTSVTVASATGITVGQAVSGNGIAPGSDVSAISGTTVTLTQQTTAAGSATPLTFTTETQVIGLAEWTMSWKRKTADATTTDDDTYESSLGSTASWSVKAKYMFIDGDPSQTQNILATITSPQSPTTWNFFPTLGTGRAAFSGSAYVDGIDIATGMGKVVGLDVSLKGTGRLNFLTQQAPVTNANTATGEQAEV